MAVITVRRFDKSLFSQLKSLVDAIQQVHKNDEQNVCFDLSDIKFVNPLFILGLSGFIDVLHSKKVEVECITPSGNSDLESYLSTIYFPDGLRPDDGFMDRAFNRFQSKSFLPIFNFPVSKNENFSQQTNEGISQINNLLATNLNLDAKYKSGVSYLISEMTDNIVDHSGEERGWMTAQYYRRDHSLDICILDNGKTIKGAYTDNNIQVENDKDAIEKAISGVSAKNNKERGYGISTSKKMIEEGLKGTFLLYSGEALIINNKYFKAPVRWEGTMLGLRLKSNVSNFNYAEYV